MLDIFQVLQLLWGQLLSRKLAQILHHCRLIMAPGHTLKQSLCLAQWLQRCSIVITEDYIKSFSLHWPQRTTAAIVQLPLFSGMQLYSQQYSRCAIVQPTTFMAFNCAANDDEGKLPSMSTLANHCIALQETRSVTTLLQHSQGLLALAHAK